MNWLNHITSETRGSIVNDADGWGVALNFSLILLFELVIIKLIYSDGMMIAYASIAKVKHLFTINSCNEDISAEDVDRARHEEGNYSLMQLLSSY